MRSRRNAVGDRSTSYHRYTSRPIRHVGRKSKHDHWHLRRPLSHGQGQGQCGPVVDSILSSTVLQRPTHVGTAKLVVPTAQMLGARHISQLSGHDDLPTLRDDVSERYTSSRALTTSVQQAHQRMYQTSRQSHVRKKQEGFRGLSFARHVARQSVTARCHVSDATWRSEMTGPRTSWCDTRLPIT